MNNKKYDSKLNKFVQDMLATSNIPFNEKKPFFKKYIENRALRPKRSIMASAVRGAGLGGAAGLIFAPKRHAAAASLIGAGLLGLMNSLAALNANGRADDAKEIISGSNVSAKLKQAMLEEIIAEEAFTRLYTISI
jgi:hypothetical protein